MQITVKGEERFIPVTTVTLHKEEGITYPFHCTACGNTLKIIGGFVTKIYPILEPSDQLITIDTCKSCKAKYVFHDGGDMQSEHVRVLLNPKKEAQTFFCYLGGGAAKDLNKILEYTAGKIYNYPSLSIINPPYVSRCMNSGCTVTYQFTQLS